MSIGCERIFAASPGAVAGIQDHEPKPRLDHQQHAQFRAIYRIWRAVLFFEKDDSLSEVGIKRTVADEMEDVEVSFTQPPAKILAARIPQNL